MISETTKSLYYELYEDENEANQLDEISLRTSASQITWRTDNAETISSFYHLKVTIKYVIKVMLKLRKRQGVRFVTLI